MYLALSVTVVPTIIQQLRVLLLNCTRQVLTVPNNIKSVLSIVNQNIAMSLPIGLKGKKSLNYSNCFIIKYRYLKNYQFFNSIVPCTLTLIIIN